MKAQERHELKTNELADWLAHFPQWLKKNKGTVIYVIVLIIVVIAAWMIRHHYSTAAVSKNSVEFTSLMNRVNSAKMEILRNKSQGVDTSFQLTDIAGELQQFADRVGNKPLGASALIAKGDALRMELCYRSQIIQPSEAGAALEPARESYNNALDIVSADSALGIKAKFGIGLCDEQAGDLEPARAIYQEIANAENADATVVNQAKLRLNVMDGFTGDVVLVDEPLSIEEPQQQLQELPEITFGPADTNEQSPVDSNSEAVQ